MTHESFKWLEFWKDSNTVPDHVLIRRQPRFPCGIVKGLFMKNLMSVEVWKSTTVNWIEKLAYSWMSQKATRRHLQHFLTDQKKKGESEMKSKNLWV